MLFFASSSPLLLLLPGDSRPVDGWICLKVGRGNHWRINLHFRAITIGRGGSVIDHSTDDFCLLVTPYLVRGSRMRGKKEG